MTSYLQMTHNLQYILPYSLFHQFFLSETNTFLFFIFKYLIVVFLTIVYMENFFKPLHKYWSAIKSNVAFIFKMLLHSRKIRNWGLGEEWEVEIPLFIQEHALYV